MNAILQEAARRRTFAIISHPDAGKTTLTEKILLYSGAIHLAGSVKGRRDGRNVVSDFGAMERERGISISSSVMQFEVNGRVFNLVDTPGHKDFSEDTYRALMAVDAVIMLINHVRGVERQTRRLFDACQKRGLPVYTFVNKLDQAGHEPIAVLDNIEKELGILTYPVTWPIGSGPDFKGIFDRRSRTLRLYANTSHGARQADVAVYSLDSAEAGAILGESALRHLREELELLDAAGQAYDRTAIEGGRLTPVFFGSALTNFGLDTFWEAFQEAAPMPRPARTQDGREVPLDGKFSGFVFKVQSNMDPRHRDRIAFLRICSGVYEIGATVHHARLGKTLPLRAPLGFLGQEREHLAVAFSGDIVGIVDKGVLQVGDTLAVENGLVYPELPRFPPEFFAMVRPADPTRRKAFVEGIEQLGREGVIQIFRDPFGNTAVAYVGVVGQLQFDVLKNRFAHEYNVASIVEPLSHCAIHRVKAPPEILERIAGRENKRLQNALGEDMVLFRSPFEERYAIETYPDAFPDKPSLARLSYL